MQGDGPGVDLGFGCALVLYGCGLVLMWWALCAPFLLCAWWAFT